GLTFYNGFIRLGPTDNVIGLDRQYFPKRSGCTVGFQGPDFHLPKSLASKLGLSAQRLLCDQGVRSYGTCVHLIVYHMSEFQHIDYPDRCRLVKARSRTTIV